MIIREATDYEHLYYAQQEGVDVELVGTLFIAEYHGIKLGQSGFVINDSGFVLHGTVCEDPHAYTALILRCLDEARLQGFKTVRFFVVPPMTPYKEKLMQSPRVTIISREGDCVWMEMEVR